MATVNVFRFVYFSCFHLLDADVSNRVVVVSSSAAAVFLCTCILLTVFLVRWNSSRGWLSHSHARFRSRNDTAMFLRIHIVLLTALIACLVIRLHPLNKYLLWLHVVNKVTLADVGRNANREFIEFINMPK